MRGRALPCEDVFQCACADALRRRKRGGVLCRAMSTDAQAQAEQALMEADNTDMRELAHQRTQAEQALMEADGDLDRALRLLTE